MWRITSISEVICNIDILAGKIIPSAVIKEQTWMAGLTEMINFRELKQSAPTAEADNLMG